MSTLEEKGDNVKNGVVATETTKESDSEDENSDWANLTRECLINILSRLTLQERWIGPMLVCNSWLIASKDSSLYSSFDLEPFFLSSVESSRWWTPQFEAKIDSMLRSVVDWSDGSLSHITILHCSDHSLSFVAERCPKLEVLCVKSSRNVTDASITQIAIKCSKLRVLDISFCYEVSHESLAILGRNCLNLTVLKRNLMNWLDPSQHVRNVPGDYLNACPQDGDGEAIAIGKFMPHLEHLEIQFSKLTARGLLSICEGCLNLTYLDIFGCMNLTSRDIVNTTSNLKNLKEIKKPNFYIPRSVFHTERYGHWQLYDERFQTDVFRI